MERETIFGIILFVFCLVFLIWKIIEGRKKIDVFYKIDGFYFKDKKKAKEYYETQKEIKRTNVFIATHDIKSKVRIDKINCVDFFKD